MNRILSFSWWSLVAGACLALCSSVHADVMYASTNGPLNVQIVRLIDGSITTGFPQIKLSLAEGGTFAGLWVDNFYNANGDELVTTVIDWQSYHRGIPYGDFFYFTIAPDTPLGLYNSSSPTTDTPVYFQAFAYNLQTGEESHIQIPLTIEVLAEPASVPEPASALLLGIGAFAAVNGCARRRARTR